MFHPNAFVVISIHLLILISELILLFILPGICVYLPPPAVVSDVNILYDCHLSFRSIFEIPRLNPRLTFECYLSLHHLFLFLHHSREAVKYQGKNISLSYSFSYRYVIRQSTFYAYVTFLFPIEVFYYCYTVFIYFYVVQQFYQWFVGNLIKNFPEIVQQFYQWFIYGEPDQKLSRNLCTTFSTQT